MYNNVNIIKICCEEEKGLEKTTDWQCQSLLSLYIWLKIFIFGFTVLTKQNKKKNKKINEGLTVGSWIEFYFKNPVIEGEGLLGGSVTVMVVILTVMDGLMPGQGNKCANFLSTYQNQSPYILYFKLIL